jgi:small GTP-binding protein
MSIEFNYLLKFIVIGDSSVGKSNIISKYKEDKFDEKGQPSIGVQFIAKNVVIENTTFRLQVWDTAGQESFRSMTRIYYKNSSCAFIVYDITEKESFNHVESWISECKKIAPETVLLVLIGNKSDLNESREVSYEEGLKFAEKNKMLFFETSAKNGVNIENIFKKSVENISNNIKEGKYDLTDDACGIKICKSEKNINIEEFDYESTIPKKVTKKKKCC